ncbi:probable arabinosyltransferase ARAD1 [Phragmites australis]|uniref:probable arabinosyltransferase ARAD1 n=1 Tax=Phragmites australis TaxID=29695 RepID=UPI002D777A1C|nr:probable arabinosyltransferase ARAD1 [Phragmites australis]
MTRGRTLLLPLAAATVLVASTIFLYAAVGARWRPADTSLPVPADTATPTSFSTAVPVTVSSSSNSSGGKDLSFLDENGRPDDPGSGSTSADRRCDPRDAALRVFMYDMPPEFHFGLLGWSPPQSAGGVVWPDIRNGAELPRYPGGLNQQHSVEYWLTLDLLSSSSAPCGAAVRVADSRDADLVFVPFFASLSYNRHSRAVPPDKVSRDKALQEKLVRYLTAQPEWKRSGGADHVIVAHHPNSLLHARAALFPAVFVLSDFGRYHPRVASLEKDVIAPYKHMAKTFMNDSAEFNDRPTMLYFRGAIYRKEGGSIRQELYYMLKDEKDVYFSFGSVQDHGASKASQGMHSSKFCLNIAGDTPSSNRLFDAIVSHCVPVIISDDIELPYEDVLDYSMFSIFVRSSDAVKKGYLMRLISGISKQQWTRMWKRLKEVDKHFEYQYPSQKDDAVQMTWQSLARRVPAIRLKVHRSSRFSRSDRGGK